MESKALQRLEGGVSRLLDRRDKGQTRQEQLAAALAKSREEIEKLKAEVFRLRSERTEARKRLDAVIGQVDKLVAAGTEANS
jgi:septal ring factor EnvC (AmiA/AmiB activator)